MFRQNQVIGLILVTFSVGLLIGAWVESGFGVFLVGVAGIAAGLSLLTKK